jgi:hypothetical protein
MSRMQTTVTSTTGCGIGGYPGGGDSGFFVALGELRATVGMQVANLAVTYGLTVDDDLASILPAEDQGE